MLLRDCACVCEVILRLWRLRLCAGRFVFTLILTLAFIKTDSGPPAAGYHDASSILIVREETMYNKYLKQ